MAERTAYFDYNATTPLHPEVAQAMTDAMGVFGNPSSLHQFGRYAKELVSAARATVGGLIGASADEILFVGSGSEANNTVLSSIVCPASGCESGMCGCHKGRPSRIVTTTIEHPCVLETAKCMGDRGIEIVFIGVDEHGRVRRDELEEALRERTGLVSVMMANNEIGTLQDIRALSDIAHQHGALFHTDAVQAVGKVPVDVDALGVDFLTMSAHKIYGPKGVGALYVRSGTPFCPLIRGGHQEAGRRAGTENTLGIVGLGKAVELRDREMNAEQSRLTLLRERIRRGIEETIPDVRFNGHPVESLPGTLNVSFEGAEGETILLYLDLEGIAVSTGSACASGSLDPSHVLLAIGTPIECAHGSIRISMGRGTTEQDADYLLEVLPRVIHRIRVMSTAYVMH